MSRFYSRDDLGGVLLFPGDWRGGIGPDLSLYNAGLNRDAAGANLELWKLTVTRWNSVGGRRIVRRYFCFL